MPAAAAKLRELLAKGTVVSPGIYDGLGARICLKEGFDTLYMTGAGTAVATLGMPDLGLVTADDMVRNAAMIASLDRSVPVIADADTGYGGTVMVERTVERYILAGVAGLHLEDQVMTKRCGHLGGKELVDEDTFISRIRAATSARTKIGDIVLIARTDALQSLGFDEAIRRLKRAVEAGADVAFLEGMTSKEEMERAAKELAPTPCLLNMVNGGVTPLVDAKEAARMGYKLVIWPIFALMAAYNAYEAAAKELKSTGFLKDEIENGEVKGGLRQVFEVAGLSKYTKFDQEMGGKTYSKPV